MIYLVFLIKSYNPDVSGNKNYHYWNFVGSISYGIDIELININDSIL